MNATNYDAVRNDSNSCEEKLDGAAEMQEISMNTYTISYSIRHTVSSDWISDLSLTVTADNDDKAIEKAKAEIYRKNINGFNKAIIDYVSRSVSIVVRA